MIHNEPEWIRQFFDFSVGDDVALSGITNAGIDPREALVEVRRYIRRAIEVMSPEGRRIVLGEIVLSSLSSILKKGATAKDVLRAIEIVERQYNRVSIRYPDALSVEVRNVTPSLIDEQYQKVQELQIVADGRSSGEDSQDPST